MRITIIGAENAVQQLQKIWKFIEKMHPSYMMDRWFYLNQCTYAQLIYLIILIKR